MVLQAWFDESGKGQAPVYLLAGYIGSRLLWEDFADEWRDELNRAPKLPYLHVSESQQFKGLSPSEKETRILRFVNIIKKHQPRGYMLMLRHADYAQFFHYWCLIDRSLTPAQRRSFRNPYYMTIQMLLSRIVLQHAEDQRHSLNPELLQIFFDENIERPERLRRGFAGLTELLKVVSPHALSLLINKEPEFRDDKLFIPLQAADLLAWYSRRFFFEAVQGNDYADNAVWGSLHVDIENVIYRLTLKDWDNLLRRMYLPNGTKVAE